MSHVMCIVPNAGLYYNVRCKMRVIQPRIAHLSRNEIRSPGIKGRQAEFNFP
jgi:hypothetical protein